MFRLLMYGCQVRFVDAALRKRCSLYLEGKVSQLLAESHETQTDRMSAAMNAASTDSVAFSKTARAAILAGTGEVGRPCKVAYTYGLETDPVVAAKFTKKLTL